MQCSLGASRTKGAYLKDKYHRLASRRGKKKAIVAIAHKILVISYHLIRDQVEYRELGVSYLDSRNKVRSERYYMKKLEGLGYNVLLTEKEAA